MREKIIGIYTITNKINGKIYVGCSKNIYSRWKSHRSELNCGKHVNLYLQNSWNLYGEENFIFEIKEKCEENQLIKKEKYWIKILNSRNNKNGYNLNDGGKGNIGMIVPYKNRLNFSQMMLGENNPMFGRKHSQETKDKFSIDRIGNKNGIGNKNNLNLVKKYKNSTSKYYGVFKSIYTYKGVEKIKWKSRFSLLGVDLKLGTFDNEISAAKEWDKKSWEIHRDLHKLNFPEDYNEENN